MSSFSFFVCFLFLPFLGCHSYFWVFQFSVLQARQQLLSGGFWCFRKWVSIGKWNHDEKDSNSLSCCWFECFCSKVVIFLLGWFFLFLFELMGKVPFLQFEGTEKCKRLLSCSGREFSKTKGEDSRILSRKYSS